MRDDTVIILRVETYEYTNSWIAKMMNTFKACHKISVLGKKINMHK